MNNLFIFIGRITKDLELRCTKENKAVLDFVIAINNGKDDTSYIKLTSFGSVAELTAKYCKKGDLVGVQGLIKNHNWEDKNGNKLLCLYKSLLLYLKRSGEILWNKKYGKMLKAVKENTK